MACITASRLADEGASSSGGSEENPDSNLPVPTLESVFNSPSAKMLLALEVSHAYMPFPVPVLILYRYSMLHNLGLSHEQVL